MFLHRRPVCSAVAHSRDGRTPWEASWLSDSGKKQPYKVPALLILLVLFFFSPWTPKHLPLTLHFFSPPPPVPVRRTMLLNHQINSSLFQLWFTPHPQVSKALIKKQLLHIDIYLPPLLTCVTEHCSCPQTHLVSVEKFTHQLNIPPQWAKDSYPRAEMMLQLKPWFWFL